MSSQSTTNAGTRQRRILIADGNTGRGQRLFSGSNFFFFFYDFVADDFICYLDTHCNDP